MGMWAIATKVVLGVLWFQLCISSVGAQCAPNDLYAMEQLWKEWNTSTPDVLHNLAGWNAHVNTNQPCAHRASPWEGVFCSAKPTSKYGEDTFNFEIVGLTLENASIIGSLPSAIGNLTNLVILTLTENPGLTGPLPEELRYLISLFDIDLHGNGFTGSIPRFFYDYFGFLQSINLSGNQLTGELPDNTTSNPTIQTMKISHNKLSGSIPPNFLLNLPNLVSVDLSYNGFTGSIPNLSSLTKLQHLDLSYNNFGPGSFPNWVTKLSDLQTLILQGASLTGDVPSSTLVSFQILQHLALDDNNLTGTLDVSRMISALYRSRSLQQISLTNNKITDVAYSDSIYKLEKLRFNLSGNPYCDNPTPRDNDLKRCVCQQFCIDTVLPDLSIKNRWSIIKRVTIIASIVSGTLVASVTIICALLFRKNRRERYKIIIEAEEKFAEYEVKPTLYTYNELRIITKEFHPSTKLGQGAFGAVYKGSLSNGSKVAVKQLNIRSQQGLDDFLNEIVVVAAVKHKNLVKLKGYCIRKDQRLLVQEYVENGDLEQFLFGNKLSVDKCWHVRKNICFGVANGIHYLHAASEPKIIHRDIKPCNILLDKNLEPKIADFGLALLYSDDESHVSTIHIAGTRGYLAPEYATLGQLSEKVDVYSYGVVLLEIVSGRRNVDRKLPPERVYLIEWAWRLYKEGSITELIDPTLELQPNEEMEALRIINIALLCVQMVGGKRPDMAHVVAMLHGGMDAEVSKLDFENEDEPFDGHFKIENIARSSLCCGIYSGSRVFADNGAAPYSSQTAATLSMQGRSLPLCINNGLEWEKKNVKYTSL